MEGLGHRAYKFYILKKYQITPTSQRHFTSFTLAAYIAQYTCPIEECGPMEGIFLRFQEMGMNE